MATTKGRSSPEVARRIDALEARDTTMPSRDEAIAKAAYFKAQKRGFTPGLEIQDWLEAEQEWRASARRGASEWEVG